MHHILLETRRLLIEVEGNSRNLCIQMSQARYLLAELRRHREKMHTRYFPVFLFSEDLEGYRLTSPQEQS